MLDGIARLRARLHAWRRIRFTAAGAVFTVGAFAVGFAAINTGNNLLYLLLGAMLGLVAVSGWLSEQAIRSLVIRRTIPRGTPVSQDVRIRYHVTNQKRRLPSMAVEIGEEGLAERAFLLRVGPGEAVETRSANRFVRRGVYPLRQVTLSTTFPFGLFLKERDITLPGELVIWPRSDRPVRMPRPGGGRQPREGLALEGAAGARGEYRGLREYRPGDDPRDIHWRSSARLEVPVIREYDRDTSETVWICLDTSAEPGDAAEAAVETAASLAARATAEGKRFGLSVAGVVVEPDSGPGQLERVLDVLARADFHPRAPAPAPPVDRASCVLVTAGAGGRSGFGDVMAQGAP